jgi:hypothetical protein
MALKNGKINPLNVLGIRKVDFPAKHFHFTFIPKYSPSMQKAIDAWIYSNLNSRYYVGKSLLLVDNSIVHGIKVGFEQEKELSFFNLACPNIS